MKIVRFRPRRLRVRGIGPFRSTDVHQVEFIGLGNELANLCLLVSANGMGKTTLLEAVAHLMALLQDPEQLQFFELTATDDHILQLDVVIETQEEGGATTIVMLSIFDGVGGIPMYQKYSDEELASDGPLDRQILYGVARSSTGSRVQTVPPEDPWMASFLASIAQAAMRPVEGPVEEPVETVPTALYFTAFRNLVRLPGLEQEQRSIGRPHEWSHRVLRVFDREQGWPGSLDNVFVWLYWLDGEGGRYARAKAVANDVVFEGLGKHLLRVRKDPPEMLVRVESGGQHRLDQLSSGERNLLQLFVRLAVFSTQNTIVLIDEVDVHLHPRWEQWVVIALKKLVSRSPGMCIIMTAHSTEVLKAFAVEVSEADLVKSADVIERDWT